MFKMSGHSSTFLERLGYLFYVASPNRTSFEKIEDVPNYVGEVVPFFVAFIILEFIVSKLKKKESLRINDAISSVSQGMLQELAKTAFKGAELFAYVYVYNNWRITTLPWNSVWTWFFAFIGVDFAYYWLHRAAHEINLFWAVHQVHHSSEEYNLSTALRQSVLTNYMTWVFYLPLALAVPPSVFLVHTQFNLLYQFWIHTEVINTLGVLEYILNTPSHHRVHHGRNRYCIDKNYAGTFIIWDRLFGTFQPEESKVVYGLTHPINTFQPLYIQLCHAMHIWNTFWETKGFVNKLSVIFKGPGWAPGKPWHGLMEDIPDVHYPVEKFTVKLPLWCNLYISFHFTLLVFGYIEIIERHAHFSQTIVLGVILYQVLSLTSIGFLLDGRSYAPLLELFRCLLYLAVDFYFVPGSRIAVMSVGRLLTNILRVCFLSSVVFWFCYIIRNISVHFHLKNKVK